MGLVIIRTKANPVWLDLPTGTELDKDYPCNINFFWMIQVLHLPDGRSKDQANSCVLTPNVI